MRNTRVLFVSPGWGGMDLYVIAGPNGVGKTTFAAKFLPKYVISSPQNCTSCEQATDSQG
ncbi:MAG TPA: hypothetical protein VGV15_11725 [Terriglobales bacterium]|nr:hypothetical protein [Terriglobales bacterium]